MIMEADAAWSLILRHFRLRAPLARDRRARWSFPPDRKTRCTGSHLPPKTRLQLFIFSRIPYLYKAL